MIDVSTMQQLSDRLNALAPPLPAAAVRLELQRQLRQVPLSPVTREEFEALRLLLRYTREYVDLLGPRVAVLEARGAEAATTGSPSAA